jgi:hypothetical protein
MHAGALYRLKCNFCKMIYRWFAPPSSVVMEKIYTETMNVEHWAQATA